MQTEDIDYTISDFATPEDEVPKNDPDQPNKSVLVGVLKELESDIAFNTSFDSINLPEGASDAQKVAAFNDMAIRKGLALHLRKYHTLIESKLKELK